MLAVAMAADSGRGGGGGAADPFAGMNIEFKEVRLHPKPREAAGLQCLYMSVHVCHTASRVLHKRKRCSDDRV